ncbi:MAG: hypothetical protein GKR92_07920 [Gammaproteobacteria bacterium]|nr:MAG: hypothetical protein GKR92_07920 [Gammaproteobacteria bacterium]
MSLTMPLRIIAVILIVAAALQFFFYNQLLVKPIVVAHVLFLLSIFSDRHTKRIAVITLGLAMVVPIGAWRMVEAGTATYSFFFINVLIFLYIAFIAFQTLKAR